MRLDLETGELARVQRELQRLITTPREDAPAHARAARAIGCAHERVAIYRGMYRLRLAREVAREFPATRALLGPARFDAEARAFAAAHPSTSFTLDAYARAFPEHVRRAGAAPAELARLERELASVRAASSRAKGAQRARTRAATGAAPRLVAAPGARAVDFSHDVDAALARFERREAVCSPRRRASQLALFRVGARAARLRVARREAPLLAALLNGDPLELAVALAVAAGLAPRAIGRALERWVRAGLLIAG
ncbi:MAG TPA: DNA-binding domain-containing protein [Myxococcota bacterium]